jgi:hypothetical protein
MRTKILAFASLLVLTAGGASAATSVDLLRQQRSRIDNAITARNTLLDRIHFAGHNNDSVQLASINASELTVEYALQALEEAIELLRPHTQKTNGSGQGKLGGVGEPLQMLCQVQVGQLVSDNAELEDSRIREEVEKQIDNVRAACSAIVTVTK